MDKREPILHREAQSPSHLHPAVRFTLHAAVAMMIVWGSVTTVFYVGKCAIHGAQAIGSGLSSAWYWATERRHEDCEPRVVGAMLGTQLSSSFDSESVARAVDRFGAECVAAELDALEREVKPSGLSAVTTRSTGTNALTNSSYSNAYGNTLENYPLYEDSGQVLLNLAVGNTTIGDANGDATKVLTIEPGSISLDSTTFGSIGTITGSISLDSTTFGSIGTITK